MFIAGDFKSGDESWTSFPRVKRGLVDQVFLPSAHQSPHDAVMNGMRGANGTATTATVALLPADVPDSLTRGALALPGHVASPWASTKKMKKQKEKRTEIDIENSSSSSSNDMSNMKEGSHKEKKSASSPQLALEMGNWDYIVATK